VKHTITGNPLVDSVAEHQPASANAYRSSLHNPLSWCPLGLLICFFSRNNGAYFQILYALIAYTFSLKMSRLLIICGPIVSVLAGLGIGGLVDLCADQVFRLLGDPPFVEEKEAPKEQTNGKKEEPKADPKKDGKKQKEKAIQESAKKRSQYDKLEIVPAEWEEELRPGGMGDLSREIKKVAYKAIPAEVKELWLGREAAQAKIPGIRSVRAVLAIFVLWFTWNWNRPSIREFIKHCDSYAQSLSNPQLMWKAQLRDGSTVIVDDYYAGYKWIDANTPKDARVMAWWDYGYQITGVANRTSIADGNTWNHEHIATLGFMLTSPEKKAHKYIRHFADYVLVWAGGRGDDMGKSPHLARIANSVFPDHCGDADPKCEKFGFFRHGKPTPMMEKSLLYKMVRNGVDPGTTMDENLFREVHKTRYGYMRVYQVPPGRAEGFLVL
jgi:dolichyl-diphosphooligosaccharide--protein glycosyltransferase